MYTSVAILALANFLAAPSPSREPRWVNDYWLGQEQGEKEQKPLAVFVGAGTKGHPQKGNLTPAIQKVLAEKWVCVYLDTTSEEGKNLARELAIFQGQGLVLSDRTGKVQAFHHDGSLAVNDLERSLVRFADPELVVQTTESNAPQAQTYRPVAVRC